MLVGREPELSELRAGLEAAMAARGNMVVLSGEAGIGKTHLADRFAEEAADQGFGVHWGRGWEGQGAPAYWPWIQVLRSVLGGQDRDGIPAWLDDRARSYFALILPELRDSAIVEAPDDSEQARFHLFDSVTRYLRRNAEQAPLLLVLDDLQLFDTSSLQLLEFFARELRAMPILVVASHRDPDGDPEAERTELLGRIGREATTLYMKGLEKLDVRALIEAQASEPPSEEAVVRVHDLTGGNPLFVSELIRLFSVGGRIDEHGLSRRSVAIPGGVRRAIRERLMKLDESLLPPLRGAAVLGPEFDARVLAEILDLPLEELRPLLGRAADMRLISGDQERAWTWSFSHVLVREVLYEDVPGEDRRRLHLLAGEALEELADAHASEIADALAYHFGESAQIGTAEKALRYSIRSAERSMQIFAYREASARFEQALALLDLTDRTDAARHAELLLGHGNALSRAGEIEGARESFLAAARGARSLGVPTLFAQAALGFGRETMTSGVVDSAVVELLEESLELIGSSDDRIRLTLLKRLCEELLYSEDVARRTELSREAVDIARRIGEPSAIARALGAQALAGAGPDTVEERLSAGLEMIKIGRDEKADEIAIDGHILRIGALLEAGDTSAADEELARYAKLGERLRQPAHRWFATVIAADRAIMSGRYDEAERMIEEARDLGETLRSEEARQYYVAQRFALLWESRRDEVVEVEDEVRRVAEEYPSLPAFRAMFLAIQAHRGRAGLVEGGLAELGAKGLANLPTNLGWLAAMALLAECAATIGDTRAAAELYKLLEPYEDHNVVFDWSVVSFGSAARYLGLLSSALGRLDPAVQHLEGAIARDLRMGARPQAARSQLDLAAVLGNRDQPGDRERGRELATDAREAFAEMGMDREVRLADRALIELGGVPLSAAPADEAALGVFRKEGEYWAIAYEGDTFRLKDAKGLGYLARLLAEPGRELHALDLFAAPGGSAVPREREEGIHVGFGEGAGPLLDPQAKAAYRRRLEELDEDAEEADRNNDPERAAKARAEREFFVRELAGAVGLGGRDRPTGSAAERARINVTKAIKTAISRIEEHSAVLGHHLQRTVRTGTYCSYQPDPRSVVSWRS